MVGLVAVRLWFELCRVDAHAMVLCRPGRLESAVAALDMRLELRRYSVAQALLFLPGLVALAALVQVTVR